MLWELSESVPHMKQTRQLQPFNIPGVSTERRWFWKIFDLSVRSLAEKAIRHRLNPNPRLRHESVCSSELWQMTADLAFVISVTVTVWPPAEASATETRERTAGSLTMLRLSPCEYINAVFASLLPRCNRGRLNIFSPGTFPVSRFNISIFISHNCGRGCGNRHYAFKSRAFPYTHKLNCINPAGPHTPGLGKIWISNANAM